nr:hypothetical protein CFP56_77433 [Quercus suber]
MDSLKNKQAAKSRQEEIKKANALRAQGGGFSTLSLHASKKGKYSSNLQSSGKSANGPSIRPKTCKGLVRMRALQIHCALQEASVKHLKIRLETEANSLKKFKEFCRTLRQEVIELKAKLGGVNHQHDELMKENANLKSEVAALHEHMDKVKEEAIEEFPVSQPYFNEMGGYYGDGFEDFRKQVVLLFLDLDFS